METNPIRWKLHLRSSPTAVYAMLSTDEGREKFWAESSVQKDGIIHFRFPDGLALEGRVIDSDAPHKFVIQYFGGSRVTFDLKDGGVGGTDLSLTDYEATKESRLETFAGWLSVLLPLKAAVDFGVDLGITIPRALGTKATWITDLRLLGTCGKRDEIQVRVQLFTSHFSGEVAGRRGSARSGNFS